MTSVGIIAEYNPLHNGHVYHIQEAKKRTGADYVIVIMSGNFVQRGAPAIVDKYIRTKTALLEGADLVIELPSYYATSSAQYFARGAIYLLHKMGVLDFLCFSSECGDLSSLSHAACLLEKESTAFKHSLHLFLKKGYSFPMARTYALQSMGHSSPLLFSPNNLLAVEYLQALRYFKSPIRPVTMKRMGASYHDLSLSTLYPSASGIRNSLQHSLHPLEELAVPLSSQSLLKDTPFLYSNDFSSLLFYQLLMNEKDGFSNYVDVSLALSKRIQKNINSFLSFTQFCHLLKTKELTYTRISRSLLHIMLGMRKETFLQFSEGTMTNYIRILGFRKSSSLLLTCLKKKSQLPIISKLADAKKTLTKKEQWLLSEDIRISHIYESIKTSKTGQPIQNEYTRPLIIHSP
jgi:predicted nucleotidyltransferase